MLLKSDRRQSTTGTKLVETEFRDLRAGVLLKARKPTQYMRATNRCIRIVSFSHVQLVYSKMISNLKSSDRKGKRICSHELLLLCIMNKNEITYQKRFGMSVIKVPETLKGFISISLSKVRHHSVLLVCIRRSRRHPNETRGPAFEAYNKFNFGGDYVREIN